jgi:hypothetical protein
MTDRMPSDQRLRDERESHLNSIARDLIRKVKTRFGFDPVGFTTRYVNLGEDGNVQIDYCGYGGDNGTLYYGRTRRGKPSISGIIGSSFFEHPPVIQHVVTGEKPQTAEKSEINDSAIAAASEEINLVLNVPPENISLRHF